MSDFIRVLCLGDVVGRPGRECLQSKLSELRVANDISLVVANGENSAGGGGIDPKCAEEIRAAGVDVITLGDHTWQRKPIIPMLEGMPSWCIRPANYPPGLPGLGATVVTVTSQQGNAVRVGIGNLMGRVMMGLVLDCPFRCAEDLLSGPLESPKIRILDIHAEATSEKIAMFRHLSGRVSLLFGTHTHVPTADQQIDQNGTGYVTDLGMCGPTNGVIGMNADVALNRFLRGGNAPYEVAEGPCSINGLLADIQVDSGQCTAIRRCDLKCCS